jgi:hypothetical protein
LSPPEFARAHDNPISRDWALHWANYERQWLFFYAVWGPLLYDEATPDRVFAALLEEWFGAGLGGFSC